MARRLLRSALFCPGDREKALQKAFTLGADVIIVDLEDAVDLNNKIDARNQVRKFLQEKRLPCVVRVNCPNTTGQFIYANSL